jgi:methanogenic corrinoid protein MtbC1
MAEGLKMALAELEEQKVLEEVRKQLDAGVDPTEILAECQAGMVEVGERFQNQKYYVSDLMMSGEIFKGVTELLGPALVASAGDKKGETVIVGTVQGDIHDIGKDLVVGMLQASGYDVVDLGVDVAPATFVEKIRETKAKVLALSGLLTLAFDGMKETVEVLEREGLRNSVHVMIGGGPVNESIKTYTGADAWGDDAMAAVRYCKQWLEA